MQKSRVAASVKVTASAMGTAIHTPSIPSRRGRSKMQSGTSPNVRRKDTSADSLPFDSAVKAAEAKVLSPENRKLVENIARPALAMENTGLPGSANSAERAGASKNARMHAATEATAMHLRQDRKTFESAALSPLP